MNTAQLVIFEDVSMSWPLGHQKPRWALFPDIKCHWSHRNDGRQGYQVRREFEDWDPPICRAMLAELGAEVIVIHRADGVQSPRGTQPIGSWEKSIVWI